MGDVPDTQVVELSIPALGTTFDIWKSYSYNSNFLTEVDGWSFTVGDEQSSDPLIQKILPGLEASLYINGNVQATGIIDEVHISASRDSGTQVNITGRDRLAPALDSNIDIAKRFSENHTLLQILQEVFEPFNLLNIVEDNADNKTAISGSKRGLKTAGKKHKLSKTAIAHQVQPYPGESALHFALRLTQRQGLWIWMSADGKDVIVSQPDFDQGAKYKLIHSRDGVGNNIINISATRSALAQPSLILATGWGGGAENLYGNFKSFAMNNAVDDGGAKAITQKNNPKATEIQIDYPYSPYPIEVPRVMMLHDDESHTREQLENFIRREMALRQRQALTVDVTVEGHINQGQPWAIDTIVELHDDRMGISENMYVLGRTFSKSRESGTTTTLNLIRPNTLLF